MNRRLVQLIQLLELKQEATRKAYSDLLKAQEQFTQNKMRHEQLTGFRLDYIHQIEVIGQEGTTIDRIRNRLNFINHLEAAIGQLNGLLAQLAKARSQAELFYKNAKISEEGVVKLIERAKKDEELKLQRREQKESDEYAQKQWHGKKNNDK
ncbi:flagellar export protein FliJ [Legionella sp. km772]|uniref:flagellar export protein FliJ n=1 Tax=Legionella sp. km772 TaxID=2498111 RepID=UPI000F8E54CF|nr:flagellar export protein FliJ [Legionella sp. km772]RUR10536.1 flagellar export protein FliJ [Legionella sp. km772]